MNGPLMFIRYFPIPPQPPVALNTRIHVERTPHSQMAVKTRHTEEKGPTSGQDAEVLRQKNIDYLDGGGPLCVNDRSTIKESVTHSVTQHSSCSRTTGLRSWSKKDVGDIFL